MRANADQACPIQAQIHGRPLPQPKARTVPNDEWSNSSLEDIPQDAQFWRDYDFDLWLEARVKMGKSSFCHREMREAFMVGINHGLMETENCAFPVLGALIATALSSGMVGFGLGVISHWLVICHL